MIRDCVLWCGFFSGRTNERTNKPIIGVGFKSWMFHKRGHQKHHSVEHIKSPPYDVSFNSVWQYDNSFFLPFDILTASARIRLYERQIYGVGVDMMDSGFFGNIKISILTAVEYQYWCCQINLYWYWIGILPTCYIGQPSSGSDQGPLGSS